MAARDPLNNLKGTGYLVKDPTDLTAASPYGGTILGTLGNHAFRPGFRYQAIAAEEWGGTPAEVVYLGAAPVFAAALRSWDNDALETLFPLTSLGGSGKRLVSHDVNADATRAGTKLTDRAHKLLFVPESVRTQPAVYFPNAVPVITGDAALQLRRDVIGAFGCMWLALPTTDGTTHQQALLEDITL